MARSVLAWMHQMTVKFIHPEMPEASALDSRRLLLFVVSAEEESFAAAAQRLGLTPSAVSHAIKGLEEDLGCMLFRRMGPRVALTAAGSRLRPLAAEILHRMEGLRREVTEMEVRKKILRIVASEPVHSGILPLMIPDFYECFPTILLEVLPGFDLESEGNQACRRELDFILTSGAGPADFVQRPILKESMSWYAAPFFKLCHLDVVEVSHLRRCRILVADRDGAKMAGGAGLMGSAPPGLLWTLPGTQCALEMARVGTGVALLPDWSAAAAVQCGSVVKLPFRGPALERMLSAWWPVHHPPSWAAEVFMGFLETAAESLVQGCSQ